MDVATVVVNDGLTRGAGVDRHAYREWTHVGGERGHIAVDGGELHRVLRRGSTRALVVALAIAVWMSWGIAWSQEEQGGLPSLPAPRAVDGEGETQESSAWEAVKRGVLAEMEQLKAEIQLLSALSLLQTQLFAWNEALLESGGGLQSMNESLCQETEMKVWCEIVPVSFGRVEGPG